MAKRSAQRHRQERREREGEKRLDTMEVKALDAVGEIVERKVGVDESRQPRFSEPTSIFSSVYRWALASMANEPGARSTARTWDTWYRAISKREPFLIGVLNSAVQIDQNRGWTLSGGRNQVSRYTKIFHALDNGAGWRSYVSWQAQSYYTTQMGAITEVGRQGRGGPFVNLWSVDPCRCEMSGNPDKPLNYFPKRGGKQEWTPDLFFRGKSLVSTDEDSADYGFPAVARCYELAKVMVGVYAHYQAKVGTRTPDAILTGKYISQSQWEEALKARNEALNASLDTYLNSIATIMSSGGDMPEFALTTLSNLPDRWDIDTWTSILMRGYALAFGYQSSEFYPEAAGVMGRGKEQEIQHESATGKGGKDFSLTHQELLQRELPPTLEFQYDERDTTGEAEDAALQLAKAQVITELSNWVEQSGGIAQSRLTNNQILQLAAEQGIIPEDWTPAAEDVTATDEEEAENPNELPERVYRACRCFPDEPIVRYSWPSNKVRVLNVAHRRQFYFPQTMNRSYADYRREIAGLARQLWSGGLSPFEFTDNMFSVMRRNFTIAWREGARAVGVTDIGDEAMLEIQNFVQEQAQYLPGFSDYITAHNKDSGAKFMDLGVRIDMWANRYSEVTSMAKLYHIENQPLEWVVNPKKEHCTDCLKLNGKVYTKKIWDKYGLHPQMHELECGGYQCGCRFSTTKKPITKGAPPKLLGLA